MPVPTRGASLRTRNRLTHHVRAHQRAVRIIVLKEGNQRGSDTIRICLVETSISVTSFFEISENSPLPVR